MVDMMVWRERGVRSQLPRFNPLERQDEWQLTGVKKATPPTVMLTNK
jgi:hypothetical protein